ncbi:MAG: hypothetical protein R3C46_16435 [Hyphomonadaceae bacterium]
MNKPGSIPWLMAHELRLFWRRGKMRPKSGLILIGLLISLWLLFSFLVLQRVGPDIPPPPFVNGPADGMMLAGLGIIIGFMASVMLSGAILAAVDVIYTRNDLDLLLSSPISPWRVLAVRSAAIAIGALPLYAGLLGPPLLWLAIFSSPLWLSSIVFLITLAFAMTALALIIVTVLFRLIGPKSTRILAQILSALAGASVFLAFQYFNIAGNRSRAENQEAMIAWFASLKIEPTAWWLLPSRAFTADIPSLLIWLAVVVALFPLGVFLFSRSFVADAAAASGMGQRKRTQDTRVGNVRGGVMASVIRKEFRLLRRDPLLLSQIGMQLLYLLPLGFILLRPGNSFAITEQAFVPVLSLLSSTLAGSLVWITVSAEDAPDLVASAPVAMGMIDRAKVFAAILPVLALMTIPVIALLLRDAASGLWAALGICAASAASAHIGLWRRVPGARRDFVRRRQKGSVIAGLGQAFVAFGISGAVGLGAYGLPLIAIIPAIIAAAILGVLYKPSQSLPDPA